MADREARTWVAPDRTEYRVRITEQAISDGGNLRLLRRIEFASVDGETIASTIIPGYVALSLLSSHELERLWREATGS